MKAIAFAMLVLTAVSFTSIHAAANPVGTVVYSTTHFDVPTTDVIPGVAEVRASCDVNASGEPLVLLSNETARSIVGTSAGPCAIVLVLFGTDVALPGFDTTPLGRSAFYLPGLSTVTLGVVDLSVDLVTSLNSTSRVADGIAAADPSEIGWPTWGAQRIALHAVDGTGSIARSELNTTFTYTMSVALSVYAVSVELYHVDLKRLGSFAGAPSLVTDLSVDLKPHSLTLSAPDRVASDQASFSWSGTVDSDVDHLELWLTDGTGNGSYKLPSTASHADVLLRPATHYEARIVTVDGAGQQGMSNGIAFDSPSAGTSPAQGPIEAQGNPVVTWTLVTLAVFAGVVGFMAGLLRGRKSD